MTELQAVGEPAIGWLHSVILGIVEGVTEFLPVSSTGHLIVVNDWLGRSDPTFEVAIQAGAITAILVLYWRDLWRAVRELGKATSAEGGTNLLFLIVAAAIPAAVVGVLFEDPIEELLFHPLVVAVALVLGGLGFFWLERRQERLATPGGEIGTMNLRQAVIIGIWQILALIPGTSRSGATIAGGLMTGLSRAAAAEFSFLVGLPILYGACVLKIAGDFERITGPMLPDLLIASAAAFVSAIIVVVPFVRFLQRHTFRPFAWYRIVAGIGIAASWYLVQ